MQYTVRNITAEIDAAARECARREGLTLNEALVRALRAGLGVEARPTKKRDLSGVFGKRLLDGAALEAIEEQQQVDHEQWE